MPGDVYPKFRAAAVQAAPVFLDRDATIDKLDALVQKAVNAGADLIVFGESFIPAFPVWNLIYAPMDQHAFFRRLFDNAVQVPGPHTKRLSEIAKRHNVILSVGITEKGSISMGALWNTNLLFDRDGTVAEPSSQARPHVGRKAHLGQRRRGLSATRGDRHRTRGRPHLWREYQYPGAFRAARARRTGTYCDLPTGVAFSPPWWWCTGLQPDRGDPYSVGSPCVRRKSIQRGLVLHVRCLRH